MAVLVAVGIMEGENLHIAAQIADHLGVDDNRLEHSAAKARGRCGQQAEATARQREGFSMERRWRFDH
jgi:hypothetical protein